MASRSDTYAQDGEPQPAQASPAGSAAQLTETFSGDRTELLRRPGPIGPGRRSALTDLTDSWLRDLFKLSGADPETSALIALGSFGRGELAPASDLDLLLLQTVEDSDVAEQLWYPIWDSRIKLDHSVRSPSQARRLAQTDYKVLLGILDARTVAGNDLLTAELLSSVRADWRAFAPKRMDEIRAAVDQRRERNGELAHLLEPDLKDSYGGLRDLVVLDAIAASWITDADRSQLSVPKSFLLDVRDALHLRTGKASDRLLMQEQDEVASLLGIASGSDLMRQVSLAGRAIAHVSDDTWYRVTQATRRSPRRPFRRLRAKEQRRPLADGVVEANGEVVLARDARPAEDPGLVLRVAASAATSGLHIAPPTVRHLAKECPAPVEPWTPAQRDLFVKLLGAGRATLPVWEALDQAGLIEKLLPEWSAVRSASQRNPIHRFTVDRHLVETAIEAAKLQREVDRPDLLLLGAILHDIGKGRPERDHTELGVELVPQIAARIGLGAEDTAILLDLVRYHLLLPEVATRRDPDDPATIEFVMECVSDPTTLDLLYALTRADAAATGPAAWSKWRAALIRDLVVTVKSHMAGSLPPLAPNLATTHQEAVRAGATEILVTDAAPGDLATVTVIAPDRPGLLATVAGVLSIQQLDVRAARVDSEHGMAISEWWVSPPYGGMPGIGKLRNSFDRALDGSLDVGAKIRQREEAYRRQNEQFALAPLVRVVDDASAAGTLIEVRTYDRPGALHRLAGAIAHAGCDIAAARVDTMGTNVIDAFYVTDTKGDLPDEDALAGVVKQLTEAAEAS